MKGRGALAFLEHFEIVAKIGQFRDSFNGLAAQAKLRWLPYRSVAEAISERFHCDIDFLKKLNAKLTESLKEGGQVTVPNVKTFELSALNKFKPGSEAAGKDTDESRGQDKKSRSEHVEAAEEASKEQTQP